MDHTRVCRSVRRGLCGLVSLLCLLALCGCVPTVQPTLPPAATAPIPTVGLSSGSDVLCSPATQIRLALALDAPWPAGLASRWELTSGSAVIQTGSWDPESDELLVGFPGGEPLLPGTYSLQLYGGEEALATHTFAISDQPPQIQRFEPALTPNGLSVDSLRIGTQHFYLRYAYTGACSGAPFWVTVRQGELAVCKHSDVVMLSDGEGAISCYRQDGEAFVPGLYSAEFELMGEARMERVFEIVDPLPTPAPTLTPAPDPVCEAPFVAAGLAPDGTPFRVTQVFEWYTQGVYVGARCRELSIGVPWSSAWFRNGTLVRSAEGSWEGAAREGVVWDSLTGQVGNPFLPSGTYTVTLNVAEGAPLTATLRILAYIRPSPTP